MFEIPSIENLNLGPIRTHSFSSEDESDHLEDHIVLEWNPITDALTKERKKAHRVEDEDLCSTDDGETNEGKTGYVSASSSEEDETTSRNIGQTTSSRRAAMKRSMSIKIHQKKDEAATTSLKNLTAKSSRPKLGGHRSASMPDLGVNESSLRKSKSKPKKEKKESQLSSKKSKPKKQTSTRKLEAI